jgi:hypothetical protein
MRSLYKIVTMGSGKFPEFPRILRESLETPKDLSGSPREFWETHPFPDSTGFGEPPSGLGSAPKKFLGNDFFLWRDFSTFVL